VRANQVRAAVSDFLQARGGNLQAADSRDGLASVGMFDLAVIATFTVTFAFIFLLLYVLERV
jgi:hypothetical protein